MLGITEENNRPLFENESKSSYENERVVGTKTHFDTESKMANCFVVLIGHQSSPMTVDGSFWSGFSPDTDEATMAVIKSFNMQQTSGF